MLGYTAFKGTIRVGLVAHVDTETIKEIPKWNGPGHYTMECYVGRIQHVIFKWCNTELTKFNID